MLRESLQQKVPREQRLVLCLAALLPAGVAGCATLPADAIQQIHKANQRYSERKYADATRLLNVVIDKHPRAQGVGEAYYLRGMCRYQEQQDELARADLEMSLQRTTNREVLAKTRAQLGHIDYYEERYHSAVEHYAKALPHYPQRPSKAEVYYRYADSLQKVGHWDRARESLPKVWHLFPRHELARYARRKFRWRHDYFAIQCGSFDRSELALKQRDRLLGARHSAVIEVDPAGERPRHMVHVGQYRTYSEARAHLPIIQRVVPDCIIVP